MQNPYLILAAAQYDGQRGEVTLTSGLRAPGITPWISATRSFAITVTLRRPPSQSHGNGKRHATSATVAPGDTLGLTAVATDSQGHTGFAWAWSDGGPAGRSTRARRCRIRPILPREHDRQPKQVTLSATAGLASGSIRGCRGPRAAQSP